MRVEFVSKSTTSDSLARAIGVLAFSGGELSAAATEFDSSGVVSRACEQRGFTGERGQTCVLPALAAADGAALVVVGAGTLKELDGLVIEEAAACAFAVAKTWNVNLLELRLEDMPAALAAHAAFGVLLAAYRFDRYLTGRERGNGPPIAKLHVRVTEIGQAKRAFGPLLALAQGIRLARDLASEPANVLNPTTFAQRMRSLEACGLKVDVKGEAAMAELGMGALLAVGRGSAQESQLVILEWNGAKDPAASPIALVGKGVTFDAGGISIKPSDGMEAMKWDMAGAAAIAGLMRTLAARKAQVNAVGILGLTENMPDGGAQRPGDILTSLSGLTVEVINTDAEGRLVLADACWYAQHIYKPAVLIDVATLTGTIINALGDEIGGLFSNDDQLSERLVEAGRCEGELLWPMPLHRSYDDQLKSAAADLKNIGGKYGGAITAALFIRNFVNDLPWAHLDIAGVAWTSQSKTAVLPEGATGFGVRLLNRLIVEHFEAPRANSAASRR